MDITSGFGDTTSNNPRKKEKDCQRLTFHDSNLRYKYGEKITFTNSTSTEYALAIGLNPALLNKQRFDSTNQKIANELNKSGQYKGYYLLNLYSIIATDVNKLCTHISNAPLDCNNNMQNIVLEIIQRFEGDMYLFWGPKVKSKRLITNIHIWEYIKATLHSKKYFYSVDSKNNFVHPGNKDFAGFNKLTSINLII